ncbi:response regulator [Paenibacillus silviterrae]|uniref:response regulator n=1 Tax=Paenibacillus silviterrae TaxID=3242194 RepID=UPI0035586AE2
MSYRVLVVDDTNFMRRMVADCLRQSGYEVVGEASNGREAVKLYEELIPDFVMMDLTMPEMNGVDAIKEILKLDSTAVILICSASNQQDLIFDALDAGAKGYVMKPFNPERLKEIIRKYAMPHLKPLAFEEESGSHAAIAATVETTPEVQAQAMTEALPVEASEAAEPVATPQAETAASELAEAPSFAEESRLTPTQEAVSHAADSLKVINLFKGSGVVKSFTSSYLCNWQEEAQGETSNYIAICTESENKIVIEMSGEGKEKQIVHFSLDGFRQLSSWLDIHTGISKVAAAKEMAQ